MPIANVVKPRTNKVLIALIGAVALKLASRWLPPDIAKLVADLLTEETLGLLTLGGGALAVYFRSKAKYLPPDVAAALAAATADAEPPQPATAASAAAPVAAAPATQTPDLKVLP